MSSKSYAIPSSSDVTTMMSIQLGYDLPPGDLIGLSSGPIGEFLRKLGKFVHEQDAYMRNPPWLQGIEKKLESLDRLKEDVAELYLIAKRPQESVQPRPPDDLDPLEAGDGGEDDSQSHHTRSSHDDNSHAPSTARSDATEEDDEDEDEGGEGRRSGSARRGKKAIPEKGAASYVTHLDMEERLLTMRKHLKLNSQAKTLDVDEALKKMKTELQSLSKHVDTKPKVKDLQSVRDKVGYETKSLKAYVAEKLTALERDMASKSENSAASLEAWKSQITGGTVEKTDDLAKDVSGLEERQNEISDRIDEVQEKLEDKLGDMEMALVDKIEELEGQGSASQEAISDIDATIKMLQEGANEAEEKIDGLQRAIDESAAKTEGKEKDNDSFKATVLERLAAQDERLASIEARLAPLEPRITSLEEHIHGAEQRESTIRDTVMEMQGTVTQCDEKLSQLLQVDFPNMANGFKEDITGSLSRVKQANELLAAQEARLAALQAFQEQAEKDIAAIPERIDAVRDHAVKIHAVTEEHKVHLEKLHEMHTTHAQNIHTTVNDHVERIDKQVEETREHSLSNRKIIETHAEKIDAHVEEIASVKDASAENAIAISNEADSRTASMARATAEQKKAVGLLLDEQKENVRRLCQDVADDVNMKFKSKDGRGVVLMNETEQRAFLHTHAENLASYCIRIEDESEERGRPPDEIDSALATEISTVSRDLAVYISEKADHEALEAMIRGPSDILEYVDDNVQQRRLNLIMTFVSMIVEISASTGKSGFHRQGARDLFSNRVHRSLESALTKFEQVLIVQHSRSSTRKLDVPKCMTCELPLVDANRRMRMMAIDNGGVVRKGDYMSTMNKTGRPGTSSQSLEKFNKNLPKGGSRPNTASKFPIREATPMAAMDWKGPKSPEGNSGVNSSYIMRGGFRMPRPQMNDEVLNAMTAPNPASPTTVEGGSGLSAWESTPKYRIGPEN